MGVPDPRAHILPCPLIPTPALAVPLVQQHLPLSVSLSQNNQVLD